MEHGAGVANLFPVLALLGAGVLAVPLFKRAGLGSVLGYLAAGIAIGPFGLRLFTEPSTILHVAELGVVMFLFVIGMEMQPSRLWGLRRQIFGLGVLQVSACGALLTGVGILLGLSPVVAFIGAMGFTLTSTAVVVQVLNERGEISTPLGQRAVSILLLEDLAIVPLLAFVAFLSPIKPVVSDGSRLEHIAIAVFAVTALVAAGRWLLNPFFHLLARAEAREVMTAAALLVVLGAAVLMDVGGLSMAMGAFLAGVLLSESTFRHQLEADIEPFRGILLGLFFIAVGMSLDLALIVTEWRLILVAVIALMAAKGIAIYAVARLTRTDHSEASFRAVLFAQGGEFAFVLYAAAAGAGVVDARINAAMTATVILSMALTPVLMLVLEALRRRAGDEQSFDGVEIADGLQGAALIIGFGRFGQVASQHLLARGIDVSIIEKDTEMIRAAADFGFKVYYGDGTRLDVLRTSGAGSAKIVLVCVDEPETANRIVELVKSEFPLARLFVRAWDRTHTLHLIREGVDYQIRETLESAMVFGEEALKALDVPPEEAAEITADNRRRDAERLELQLSGGTYAGRSLLRGNISVPTPLVPPKREGKVVDAETAGAADKKVL
ncbi:MAG: cation:proton antiporter [Bradyrhizobiaceae bacterium]|nr:cation:proton antiporter [Bradyrhizobiaceae bacterium]